MTTYRLRVLRGRYFQPDGEVLVTGAEFSTSQALHNDDPTRFELVSENPEEASEDLPSEEHPVVPLKPSR